MIRVRAITPADRAAWLAQRRLLWPHVSAVEHAHEVSEFLAGRTGQPLAVLVATDGDDATIGFVELSIRRYAEGCTSTRVAYLEGWYVSPEARRKGVGRALIAASEAWGRAQGCPEFASDTELDNQSSAAAHRALGFEEVVRLRCFRKAL